MLNERGDQFLAEIDAGVLDSATFTHDSEYKALGSRYRLVLSPKSLVLEDGCSLDVCIKFTKATPLCRNTSEYVLNISLNVHKFSPGHFESPLTMRITDTKAGFPLDDTASYSFRRVVKGEFRMPRVELRDDASLANHLAMVLNGTASSVQVEVANVGNAPVNLGNWRQAGSEASVGSITLDGCNEISLASGSSCKLRIGNPTRATNSQTFIAWKNNSSGDTSYLQFYMRVDKTGTISYGIGHF